MFEAHVLHLLRKYLGEYVHGLSIEALRISVWKGDVVLKDLKLKAEALNSLKLPVTVNAGFVGTITLKVPWKSLGKEPVVVLIDRVFLLAHPAPDGHSLKEEDTERLFHTKLQQIEEAELATLEASARGIRNGSPPGVNSWLSSLIATIIGNLKITISNVHIRYEDSISNPGHPFSCGITLAKLAAVTMDEYGNETFDTSGALDKLRKSLQLQRLAVYHDSESKPWMPLKKWENLNPHEWREIFEDGIDSDRPVSSWADNRKYLVSPINGILKYHRLGKQERHDPEIPFEKASLIISNVSLTLLEAQYYDAIKLLETLSRYKTRVEVSHLRPVIPVSKNAKLWWRYTVQAILQQKRTCHKFSWERIRYFSQLRRNYVRLYASSLQKPVKVNSSEMREIERDLDSKIIILWRLLAHAKLESVKTMEAEQQRGALKRSWWSFGWRSAEDSLVSSDPVRSQLVGDKLTKEEWQAINKMLSYEANEDTTVMSGKDLQTMMKFLIDVSIEHAAARIVGIDKIEILCGRFEQLQVTTKSYHRSINCDVSLRFCGLSAPEGTLAQSISSEKKVNALSASFVRLPLGDNVDWRLSATIAPCHVTVFMESYERFLGFMKRSNAVSPVVALETATALQMKIEQVTRRAQEQFQSVLEEQSRFALDIDFDAPKVRIPFGICSSFSSHGHFLLDLGHFTLQTRESEHDEQRQSFYSHFHIAGRDIAAFFKDGSLNDGNCCTLKIDGLPSLLSTTESTNSYYSLLDRCRMAVIVDLIKVPHPNYPSTRIAIQVPNLSIHFSPARYGKFIDLLNIFYGPNGSSAGNIMDIDRHIQVGHLPWYPADLASDARVLVWRGIGNSMAEWQPCFLVLSGLHLYVLDSGTSQCYQRCCSIAGRHVFEVSPASVGGSQFSIAVSLRGIDVQKALESSSTMIVEFRDNAEKTLWLKGLVEGTYRTSTLPDMDVLGKTRSNALEPEAPSGNHKKIDLIINGALLETKLSIYGKLDRSDKDATEALIIDILASGGKVILARSGSNLTAKMKLHSLNIKDDLLSQISNSQQYLACSVLSHGSNESNASFYHDQEMSHKVSVEEEDVYKDALSDFINIPDQSFYDQSMDIVASIMPCSLDEQRCQTELFSTDGISHTHHKAKGRCTNGEVFYEAEDVGSYDFVVVTFATICPDSPQYVGVDTQMSIRMSKLDFFCNRPTLVALIELGFDLSVVNSDLQSGNEVATSLSASFHEKELKEESGRAIVKGLLGFGKTRVVFYLKMDIDTVCIFLNKEDGSQLAMLVQECFLLDLKIHPSSLSIDGTLGNLRLCDMSLGQDHCWGWLCDIRNQKAESLIKFTFQSYSLEDDDYEGYDYRLSGRLSAVRIVFLYRFVQEIMAYFLELATPHTEEVIKLVDKVGGFEWLIQKYEIDGASSLKLDLSLDTPIIIMPYNSMSRNYIQLDLGQLEMNNSFSWHGGEDKDPSSVHLDILHVEIHGVNMAVGVDGHLGKPMIREGQGLEIQVCRSLRDIFRKVPTVSVEVKIGLLHCVMSDKEYSIILDCAYTNVSEEPRLPPSFRRSSYSSKESIRTIADKVNLNGQMLFSRTVAVVAVDIQYALLELCNRLDEETPLAQIAVEGLWVSYRYTSLSETDLYLTIPKFSVLDIRPETKPEMRLMLGSSSDVYKQSLCNFRESGSTTLSTDEVKEMDMPNLTMLIMDYRWRSASQSIVIRVQQPHVLVVLDFLLAVVEFFVPALRAITGSEETLDPKNDPISNNDNIIIMEPFYTQRTDVIILSRSRQLIVDCLSFDEVIYDGCGGTIHLTEENEINDSSLTGPETFIIIVGHGKRLRFKNVKIQNGALLLKCTYLGNDSSFSVAIEDGVEVSLKDNDAADFDNIQSDDYQGSLQESNDQNINSDAQSTQIQSFSFEAQVVSPEFTFYDSTKVSLDDSLHAEKLLRAKVDVSFMYVARGNDIWVRSLVKDLSVEAGSGLVILEPVDISGGYTSVKDKTSISLVSSDICIHLSLSVASLLLQLQSQATAALQFGNASPVAFCTNFNRIWVSRKENDSGYNLTFWRPQAPSNYAILGDCVTSRSVPPSQVVMAISNTYGRVRKPVGFRLIGLFSDLQSVEDDEAGPAQKKECSLWMPVAPPGYSAMGCVAHLGSQPPPNHIVYCIRSDLVTSATFSDCIFSVPSNPRNLSGFSIWRIDNSACSFYGHDSVEYPPKFSGLDLHCIVLCNHPSSSQHANKSKVNVAADNHHRGRVASGSSTTSSGWEILRSFSKSGGCYLSTPHFERIWWDKGSDSRRPVSVWRPVRRPGFSILGDCFVDGLEPPAIGLIFRCDSSEISSRPVQFTKVAHIMRKGLDGACFWYPIAPPGFASLGCVVTKTDDVPDKDIFCCPRMDLVCQANISELPVSSSTKGPNYLSIWKIENQAGTFLARSDLKRPSSRLAHTLNDHVKTKTRHNVSAEMKLGRLSFSVLDGIHGRITPLLDVTVTNMNLATHGRFEAMNAVLICSIAASTFNRQLEAWEPFVEPFDGIFKLETYETYKHPSAKVGKRVRLAASSIVNFNLSAAILDTFAESVMSWRRQNEYQQNSTKHFEESDEYLTPYDDSTFSALEEDDLKKVILENRLGCDLYLRKFEESLEKVELLQHGSQVSVSIPPPRLSDRLNVVPASRGTRFFIAVHILHAKELPIIDDGNGQDFFCALRLIFDSNTSDCHKLFPQSARTRCARPLVSKLNGINKGIVKWNELFLFEVPEKGLATLELEITNLSSKAGKGEIIGSSSVPIRNSVNALKRTGSLRLLMQSSGNQQFTSYTLNRKGQCADRNEDCGNLLISTAFFERKNILSLERKASEFNHDRDIGFWVGLGPKGPWERFGSLLTVSVIPKSLDDKYFAFEVSMINAKKHAIFRPLAGIINNADVKLELSVCPASMLGSSNDWTSICPEETEELFENQRFQPNTGWGSKWSGLHNTDPSRWSTRDFSNSSKDFPDIPLPPGWKWTSAWTIDKSPYVDTDGWAYGPDFHSLKWPVTSASAKSITKSLRDVVRRRRWIRTRNQLIEKNLHNTRNVFGSINPGSSTVLPWSTLNSDTELCLQVRPYNESSEVQYRWGQTFCEPSNSYNNDDDFILHQALLSGQKNVKHRNSLMSSSVIRLNHFEKKDFILYCNSDVDSNKHFWLSVGVDASVLHTEFNFPVYDWKITLNSPLRLENKLPYPAEYLIWEKTIEGNMVRRQHGTVPSGSRVFIYSVDLQRPVYLTLFVQGGWALEKDPILIMDLSSLEHVSSFWMVHKQTQRRLRVSIECDSGGSFAAPKTVRFFVPYWIKNDSSVPLSYRIVEIEPLDSGEVDSPSLSRAVKSAKLALKHTSSSVGTKNSSSKRNIQVFEAIEEPAPPCVMWSPLVYTTRTGTLQFQSHNELFLSPRVGVAIAACNSEQYSPGISLYELEKKERVDVKAFAPNGYYQLSAFLDVASDRTKVVHIQPRTLFINRIGCNVSLKQCGAEYIEWFHPADPPKLFKWQTGPKTELLKLRLDGYNWSMPFSIETEGVMGVLSESETDDDRLYVRVEVRRGVKSSRYEVIFRISSCSTPYRIENRSLFFPIRFRQVGGFEKSWRYLPPNTSVSFCWEDLGRRQLLEVLVDGDDPSKSEKYNIDNIMEHQLMQTSRGTTKAMYLSVHKDGRTLVSRISDWMPGTEMLQRTVSKFQSTSLETLSDNFAEDSEFHITLELAELGLSVVDHMPEEILYVSVQNLLFSYSTGLGSGISRFKLRMVSIQVDNQLPFTPMPVLFRPQRVGDQPDYVFKFSLTMQRSSSMDLCIYPYLGVQGPENSAFMVNIHEPVIWRLHEMIHQAKLNRIYHPQTTAVSLDPIIQIGLLNISEIRFKISMIMSPTQRPGGVLGFWSSLMTALGNMENMPVRISQRYHEEISMRQSALISTALSNVQKDLLSQPLQLLSGVDILGNASSALGHMSKGVAALSMDKKFIQSRQKQESKGVEDIGDVIREGGGALAKGFFRGVTGILTKPLEGAKSSGVEGFVQGVGKGIIGAAAQPVSGVLDLLSKTTEGANAVRMKIASAITSEEQMLRKRLPRVIGGDNLLKPYDENRASGQGILQLAESGTFLGQVDLFKVRGKFALSDAYEDHFLLPKGKILLVTHRRVLSLQQPTNIIAHRKFNPARDPCSVMWDLLWDDLVTMELGHGNKDNQRSPPSRLILYLQTRSTDIKEHTRIVKCHKESQQAVQIYTSIERAMDTYGPNRNKEMQKTVTKPYSPCTSADSSVLPKKVFGIPVIEELPTSVPTNSFGKAH